MRSSSWLYQYSSQSKFNYGVCAGNNNQGNSAAIAPYNQQQQQQQQQSMTDCPRTGMMMQDNESSQQSYNVDDHQRSVDQQELSSELSSYPLIAKGKLMHEDAEPVDMSTHHLGGHSMGYDTVKNHQRKYHHQKGMPPCASYRAKFIQFPGGQCSAEDSPKYLTDLDKVYADSSLSHRYNLKAFGGGGGGFKFFSSLAETALMITAILSKLVNKYNLLNIEKILLLFFYTRCL